MACSWSAEKATRAFLRTLKTVSCKDQHHEVGLNNFLQDNDNNKKKKAMEPDVAEFISAMAAGSGARVMVEVCAGSAGHTTLALVAAAQQTGGRVVCVVAGEEEVRASVVNLGEEAISTGRVEIVVGDAPAMLGGPYKGADFVLVDCDVEGYESVVRAAEEGAQAGGGGGGVVVGYNAFGKTKGGWASSGTHEGIRVDLLPIGTGLRVARVAPAGGGVMRRRTPVIRRSPSGNQWVVRVDQCTGEEHVFRVRSPRSRKSIIEA